MADTEKGTRLVGVRHGQTEWSLSGRHTGLSDIPVTDGGRRRAAAAAFRLDAVDFARAWTSPRSRTTAEIRSERPRQEIFRDGFVGGESRERVIERVRRIVDEARAVACDVLGVSHRHLSRNPTARRLELDGAHGRPFAVSPASLSMPGWKRELPVALGWSDACDLGQEWCSHAVCSE